MKDTENNTNKIRKSNNNSAAISRYAYAVCCISGRVGQCTPALDMILNCKLFVIVIYEKSLEGRQASATPSIRWKAVPEINKCIGSLNLTLCIDQVI